MCRVICSMLIYNVLKNQCVHIYGSFLTNLSQKARVSSKAKQIVFKTSFEYYRSTKILPFTAEIPSCFYQRLNTASTLYVHITYHHGSIPWNTNECGRQSERVMNRYNNRLPVRRCMYLNNDDYF